jgi:hypothetical protein
MIERQGYNDNNKKRKKIPDQNRSNEYMERNQEIFSSNIFDQQENNGALIRSKIGNPPYEFLNGSKNLSNIPAKFVDRKKSNVLDPEYLRKYPNPNYSNFGKPEFVDDEGREYRLAPNENPIKKGLRCYG